MWIPDGDPIAGGGGGAPAPVESSPAPSAPAASPSPTAAPAAVTATPTPDSSAAPASATPSPATPLPGSTPEPAATPAAGDGVVQPAKSFLSEALEKNKPPEAPKPAEVKPAEAKPGEAKPGEAAPIVAAEPAKIAWQYEIPEEISLNPEGTLKAKVSFDDDAKAKVNSMLEAFSTNPGDKANQQALVDFHIDRLAEQQKQTDAFNKNFWNDTRKQWRDRWAKDPEIGGSGIETSRATAARVLDIAMRWNDTSQANKAFHEDVEQFFEITGGGDHPALGRILTRLGRFLDESPPPPPNIKPPPDVGRQPGRGRLRDRYNSMP